MVKRQQRRLLYQVHIERRARINGRDDDGEQSNHFIPPLLLRSPSTRIPQAPLRAKRSNPAPGRDSWIASLTEQ
jgi:hypothetical protein